MVELDPSIEKKYEKVISDFENKCNEKQENELSYGFGVRHLQCMIFFGSLCVTYFSRAHFSATIVAMTDVPPILLKTTELMENTSNITASLEDLNITKENDTNTELDLRNKVYYHENKTIIFCIKNGFSVTVCEVLSRNETIENYTSSIWNVNRVYAWPKSTQEMVMGSFFLGYMVMMSPFGLVIQRWGGKLPMQISIFSTAIISFLTPWLAVVGDYKAVCITRVVMGLTQAGAFPCLSALLAKWVPVSERGRLSSYVYTGSMLGSILAYHASGFLAASTFGWPSTFWVSGLMCLIMGLLLTWIVAPTPQQHRSISDKEKNFILGGVKDQSAKRLPTPWKAIMTSKPAWACFVAHIGTATTFYFLFAQIPSYLHHAIGINIKNSGLLSSLPYLSNLIMSIVFGNLCDFLINRKIMSMKLVRIISNCIANFGVAFFLYLLTFITNQALAVLCLNLCMMCHAANHTAWMVNYIDLSPNFSGTLMATGNTLMNITALLLPVLVSYTVPDMTNLYQWRIVAFVVGTVGVICNIVYIIFMSVEIQPWNDSGYQPTVQEDPDTIERKAEEKKELKEKHN